MSTDFNTWRRELRTHLAQGTGAWWLCGPVGVGKTHLITAAAPDVRYVDLQSDTLMPRAAVDDTPLIVDHVGDLTDAQRTHLLDVVARPAPTVLVGRAPRAPVPAEVCVLGPVETWHDAGRQTAMTRLVGEIGAAHVGDEAAAVLESWAEAYGDTALGRTLLAEQFALLGLAAAGPLSELAVFRTDGLGIPARQRSLKAAADDIVSDLAPPAAALLDALARLGPLCEADVPLIFAAVDATAHHLRALLDRGAIYLSTDRPRTVVALSLFGRPAHAALPERLAAVQVKLAAKQRQRLNAMANAWRRAGQDQDGAWLTRHVPRQWAAAHTTEERVELLVASEPHLALAPAAIAAPPLSDVAAQVAPRHPLFVEATRIIARAHRVRGHRDEAHAVLDRALQTHPDAPLLLMELAVLAHEARDLFDAEALYQRANDMVPPTDRMLRARAAQNWGALYHDMGELDLAEQQYVAALDELCVEPNPRLSGIIGGNLGVLRQERGDWDAAATDFSRALADLRAAGDARFLGITLGNAAALALLRGDPDTALVLQSEALAMLRRVGDLRSCALGEVRCALAHQTLGAKASAGAAFGRARDALRTMGDKVALRGVELAQTYADLLDRERPLDGERLTAARETARAGSPCLVEQNDEARFVMRLFERRAAADTAASCVVLSDGSAFITDGETTDLTRRPALQRVLAYLAAQKGTPRSIDDIFDAGWGEQADTASARNRVYVALSTLRKLGLKAAITRSDAGYGLAASAVVRENAPA